jgi:hypothetical protein
MHGNFVHMLCLTLSAPSSRGSMLKKMIRDTRPLKVIHNMAVVYHLRVRSFISQMSFQDANRKYLRASELSCETVRESHNSKE